METRPEWKQLVMVVFLFSKMIQRQARYRPDIGPSSLKIFLLGRSSVSDWLGTILFFTVSSAVDSCFCIVWRRKSGFCKQGMDKMMRSTGECRL